MVLRDWLEGLGYELVQGSLNWEVTEVVHDSRKVVSGAVFVYVAGARVDSHGFVSQVLKVGVGVLVTERGVEGEMARLGLSLEELADVTILRTKGGRRVLALLSATRFGYPAKKMITTGVTGAKGETTTTHMIKAILEVAGKEVRMIGTTGIIIDDTVTPTVNTIPESWQLHQAFSQMAKSRCQYVITEVSSQETKVHRVDGITFDYGIFTSISPDHIDPSERAGFEEHLYYRSRILNTCKVGPVDAGNNRFRAVVKNASCATHIYSVLEKREGVPDADFTTPSIRYVSRPGFVGTEFDVKDKYEMDICLGIPGLSNVNNALAAASICSFLNLSEERISHALEYARVNGRTEIVHISARCTMLMDYAHNAVGMESLLFTLCQYHPKRLVVVFGCGGSRSKERRYSMDEIGGKPAGLGIVIADNSHFEKVEDIIADIRGNIEKTRGIFIEIPSRRETIECSITRTRPGDMVAVIRKGHEDYQEINGVRYHFLDREVIEKVVSRLGDET